MLLLAVNACKNTRVVTLNKRTGRDRLFAMIQAAVGKGIEPLVPCPPPSARSGARRELAAIRGGGLDLFQSVSKNSAMGVYNAKSADTFMFK